MAARDTNHDAGFHPTGPVIESVAVLAITYIAMFFAVAGVTHAPISPEAAATALTAPMDDTASSSPSSVSESLQWLARPGIGSDGQLGPTQIECGNRFQLHVRLT